MTEFLSDRIVRVALSQVGERERAPNVTIYHDWYDTHGTYRYSGQSWCAIFVCWVLDQAGARLPTIQGAEYGTYPGAAGVSILLSCFRGLGWILLPETDPLPGDVVFYSWSHVGIVVRVLPSGHVVTVEGNTQRESEVGVCEWVWSRLRITELEVKCFGRITDDHVP